MGIASFINKMASSAAPSTLGPGFIVAGRYRLVRKIGSGHSGEVYLCVNTTDGEEAAAKIEPIRASHPRLPYESKLYKTLQGGVGIPHIWWHGPEGDYTVLVMDLLGQSLEAHLKFCYGRFTMKTVLMLADQMIRRIEFVHNKNFIHRSIKPENFCTGIGPHRNKVFLIDFGRSKKYIENRTCKHIAYRENMNHNPSPYASINANLGYVLMYFNRGSLPWQDIKAANEKQKYEKSVRRRCLPLWIFCAKGSLMSLPCTSTTAELYGLRRPQTTCT